MSERTPEQLVELLKKGHKVRQTPEEEFAEYEQRIAELEQAIDRRDSRIADLTEEIVALRKKEVSV